MPGAKFLILLLHVDPMVASASASAPAPLFLPAPDCRELLRRLGPSLGLWRGAEIAALREQRLERPLLDLGCGDGLVTSFVTRYVDIGLDPDLHALVRAARHRCYGRLVARPMELAGLPPASVATAISNSVLEHLPRLDVVLRAVANVLRRGGRLIFTVPTETFGGALLLPLPRYRAWRNAALQHVNLWPLERWRTQLDSAGFEVLSVRPYLRTPWVRTWDALELMQQVWIRRTRLFGVAWRRLPPALLTRLAEAMSRLDLAAVPPGGGRLIVARRR